MGKYIESLKYTFLYDLISPLVQIFQILNWHLKGKLSPPPHLLKQQIVKEYQKRYHLQIFIETGTYLGTMINVVKDDFQKIFTIELDKKLYKNAKKKFRKFKHIKVINGDSSLLLPEVLKKINKPSLFWLDAHYSKGITSRGLRETPIAEELTSILNHKIKEHIILIDDADAFNGKNDYPSQKFLRKYISKLHPDLLFEIKYNIIRITPGY